MDELPILCPAGAPLALANDGAPGCRCRVEDSTLTTRDAPASIVRFCADPGARSALIDAITDGPGLTEARQRLRAVEHAADVQGDDYTTCPSWRTARDTEQRERIHRRRADDVLPSSGSMLGM